MDTTFLARARVPHLDGTASFGASSTSLVPWWSFTKTILAAAVVRLVRVQGLDLDARLPGHPFSLRQLLQHRAGVPNYGHLPEYHDAVSRRDDPWPAAELLERAGATQLCFEPGHGWAYSNTGYLIVRQWLENRTSMSLDDALATLVFDPLGIRSVTIPLNLAGVPANVGGLAPGYDPGWVYHGLAIGSAQAAAALLHSLLSGDLLGDEGTRALTSVHSLDFPPDDRPWRSHGYGLGIMGGRVGDAIFAGHSGAGPGSTIAVYSTVAANGRRHTAAVSATADQGMAEWEAIRLCDSDGQTGRRHKPTHPG